MAVAKAIVPKEQIEMFRTMCQNIMDDNREVSLEDGFILITAVCHGHHDATTKSRSFRRSV